VILRGDLDIAAAGVKQQHPIADWERFDNLGTFT